MNVDKVIEAAHNVALDTDLYGKPLMQAAIVAALREMRSQMDDHSVSSGVARGYHAAGPMLDELADEIEAHK